MRDFTLLDHEGRSHRLYEYGHVRGVVIVSLGTGCPSVERGVSALNALHRRVGYPRGTTYDAVATRRHLDADGTTTRADVRRDSGAGFAARLDGLLGDVWTSISNWTGRLADDIEARISRRFNEDNWRVAFFLLDADPRSGRPALKQAAERYATDLPILDDETQVVMNELGIHHAGEAVLIDTRTWRIVHRDVVVGREDAEATAGREPAGGLESAIDALVSGQRIEATDRVMEDCAIDMAAFDENQRREISYAEEIAPMLVEKCRTCHRRGGIAPWSMDDHETVKAWSPVIRQAVMVGRMPPWHADPDAGPFLDDASMNPREKQLLVQWIDAGAPRGGGPDPLREPIPPVAQWPLGEPDAILEFPLEKLPAQGPIDWRYPSVPIPFDEDVWIRAAEIRPENAEVLHHALAFVFQPGGAEAGDADRVPLDDRPSSEEFMGGLEQAGYRRSADAFFAAYVPGHDVMPFPRGTGIRVARGSRLVLQIHYEPMGVPTTDRPRVALYLHERAPGRSLRVTNARNALFRIPPYARDHIVEAALELGEAVTLYGVFPHMHYRGRSMRYEAVYPDGERQLLLSVPRFSFDWQRTYMFATPPRLPAGTTIEISSSFDNSPANPINPDPSQAVVNGGQSVGEMQIGYMLYAREREDAD